MTGSEPPRFERWMPREDDSIGRGVGFGCLTQFILLAAGAGLMVILPNVGGYFVTLIGVSQWIVMVPMIRHFRSQGQTETVFGLIMIGSLGFMLTSGCAGVIYLFGR